MPMLGLSTRGSCRVGIVLEELGVDDLVGEGAADRERVADDRPLRLAVEAQNLAEVVDQAGDDEPARLVRAADRLGRLQRVLDLREVGVRIAVVDERVQEVERLPDGHRACGSATGTPPSSRGRSRASGGGG